MNPNINPRTNQYFNENPAALTQERMLNFSIFDMDFRFTTNNGLFSHSKVDAGSILLLEHIPPITGSLLDLGCGYGVIGIVLGKKNNITLTMSDINSIALGYAKKNAKLNNVQAQCIHSDGFESLTDKYDTIVLNPPIHAGKEVMYKLYAEAAQHLHPSGVLYIVIQKKHGAQSTLNVLKELFKKCQTLHKKKGYYIFQCARGIE